MSTARSCSITDSRALAGSAPGWTNSNTPSRNPNTVGIEVICSSPASSRSASVSTLANVMSECFSDAAS